VVLPGHNHARPHLQQHRRADAELYVQCHSSPSSFAPWDMPGRFTSIPHLRVLPSVQVPLPRSIP
jgi:hypothetical protein